MKKMFVPLSLALMLAGSTLFTSCKSKAKDTTTTTTTTPVAVDTLPTYTAPVEVSADDALSKGVMDATKDFPGVNATVANGEITVAGDMKRADWQRLKPILDGLNPKKVNNQLTLK